MDRKKRKCCNPDCRVHLKQAEEKVNETDVLGSALKAPVRNYNHNFRETTMGFTVEEGGEVIASANLISLEKYDVTCDMLSLHSNDPVKITVSYPAFVNPSSYSLVKEVLRKIGKAAGVRRYCNESRNP